MLQLLLAEILLNNVDRVKLVLNLANLKLSSRPITYLHTRTKISGFGEISTVQNIENFYIGKCSREMFNII